MNKIKKDFPFFKYNKNIIYLDNAATTQKSKLVIDSLNDFYIKYNAPINRSIYSLAEKSTYLYNLSRKKIADFIGCNENEIIFTSGTTDSINLVAHAWAMNNINQDDEIIITEMEHNANILPWIYIAKLKNAIIKYIPIKYDGSLDYKYYKKILSKKTKLVAFSHVSNVLGYTTNLEYLVSNAKKYGAKTLLDAAQSIAHNNINVKDIEVDFLAFSSHKISGPNGVGILYINKEIHNQISHFKLGGSIIQDLDYNNFYLNNSLSKLETGSQPSAEIYAFSSAIDYIKKNIERENILNIENEYIIYLKKELSKNKNISILGNYNNNIYKQNILSFYHKNYHSHDIAHYLSENNIAVRAGKQCAHILHKKLKIEGSIRISLYWYNSLNDIKKIAKLLKKI